MAVLSNQSDVLSYLKRLAPQSTEAERIRFANGFLSSMGCDDDGVKNNNDNEGVKKANTKRRSIIPLYIRNRGKSNNNNQNGNVVDRKELNYCAMVIIEYMDWRKEFQLDDPIYVEEKNLTDSDHVVDASGKSLGSDYYNWEDACTIALERQSSDGKKSKKLKLKWMKKYRRRRQKQNFIRKMNRDITKQQKLEKRLEQESNHSEYQSIGPSSKELSPHNSSNLDIKSEQEQHQQQQQQQQQQRQQQSYNPLMELSVCFIPQLCFVHKFENGEPVVAKDGRLIVHMLPELIDTNIAKNKTFGLLFSLYLENYLDRNNADTICLAIDVRAGMGWPNANLSDLVSFIRVCAKTLHLCHPERIHRVILYPVSNIAKAVWEIIKKILPEMLRTKTILVTGNDSWDAPPPYQGLEPYIEKDVVEIMETKRKEAFRNISNFEHIDEDPEEIIRTTALAVEQLLIEENGVETNING